MAEIYDDASQDEYKLRQGQSKEVPVVSDSAKVEDPIDATTADSDAQLGMSIQQTIIPDTNRSLQKPMIRMQLMRAM
jgi:hypothetical protein